MQDHFQSMKFEVVTEKRLLLDASVLFFGSAFFLSHTRVSSSYLIFSTRFYFSRLCRAFSLSRTKMNSLFFLSTSLFFFSASAYFFLNSSVSRTI